MGIPATESALASPSGFTKEQLIINGQATQTGERQTRGDVSLTTELKLAFGADAIQPVRQADSKLTVALAKFLSDRDAAAAWSHSTAPVLSLILTEGAQGHLQMQKSTEPVFADLFITFGLNSLALNS